MALLVLDRAESRSGVNWEIRYREGPHADVPPLMEIRLLANVSAAASLVALADGQADEAARHVRLGLVLANSLAQERLLIIQLIRAAVERIALRPLRETLAAGEPSAAALEALATRLAETAGESQAVAGLTGEMKYVNTAVAGIAAGRDVPVGIAANRNPGCAEAVLAWIIRPAVVAAQARMLDQFDQTIRYARLTASERASGRVSFPLDAPEPWWWKPFPWLQYARSGLTRAIASSDENDAMRALASTAVALRRHRLAHGAYPATLAELDPSLLARPPIDPYTGQPIEYMREGAGFTLRIAVPASAARNVELKDMFVWKVPRSGHGTSSAGPARAHGGSEAPRPSANYRSIWLGGRAQGLPSSQRRQSNLARLRAVHAATGSGRRPHGGRSSWRRAQCLDQCAPFCSSSRRVACARAVATTVRLRIQCQRALIGGDGPPAAVLARCADGWSATIHFVADHQDLLGERKGRRSAPATVPRVDEQRSQRFTSADQLGYDFTHPRRDLLVLHDHAAVAACPGLMLMSAVS